jgi:putative sterol carrier protein
MSTVTAMQFFDRELPRLFREGKARSKRKADVIFEVGGEAGGRWRLHLGSPPDVKSLGSHDDAADLLIRMDASEFAAFVEGTLDVVEAVHGGRLILAGDLSLVEEMAGMFPSRNSPIGAFLDGRKK